MTIKDRILAALDCAIDDVSEDRLIDILLDAYQAKVRRISELEAENAAERERLHLDREQLLEEHRRMRNDPLYCAQGDYYFFCNGHRLQVTVRGSRMDMVERRETFDFPAQRMSAAEWLGQRP